MKQTATFKEIEDAILKDKKHPMIMKLKEE